MQVMGLKGVGKTGTGLPLATNTVSGNVWRFAASNAPVRRIEGGYWMKVS